MAIKASTRTQVGALLRDLAADTPLQRDSAVARLTLIGPRAVPPLLTLAADAAATLAARISALQALEGIGDPRALEVASAVLDDPDPEIAAAAAGVLGVFLRSARGAEAVESLTRAAVDRRRPDAIRLAAIGVLSSLAASTRKPLFTLLEDDPSDAVRTQARPAGTALLPPGGDSGRIRSAAAGGALDDASAIRGALTRAAHQVSLSVLRDLIERVREHEAAAPPARRDEWTAVRAAAHGALARRGSRLALYDLRESLESASGPVPIDFLTALSLIGDASCLESIAAAYASASAPSDPNGWWRRQLRDLFQTIVRRERVTRRHAAARKIDKRWKAAMADLWPVHGRAGNASRAVG